MDEMATPGLTGLNGDYYGRKNPGIMGVVLLTIRTRKL